MSSIYFLTKHGFEYDSSGHISGHLGDLKKIIESCPDAGFRIQEIQVIPGKFLKEGRIDAR